jgi:dipeptidyl aminopeptidase/acylaminoacyl peptidase
MPLPSHIDKETSPNPLPAEAMAGRLGLRDVQWDSDGRTLVWLESRAGRGMLVARAKGGATRDLAPEHDVRARVAYGGGDFTVARGQVVFAGLGGRLYRQPLGSTSSAPISPTEGVAAAPAISSDGRRVVFVHSHQDVDRLVIVALDASSPPVEAARGADFYMQPTWHPAGDRMAWIEWDHPNMPWDGTRLMMARREQDSSRLVEPQQIAGGPELPVFQPSFSPDGRSLAFVQGEGEWDQLCVLDLVNGTRRAVLEGGSLLPPAWLQGMRTHAWSADGRRLLVVRSDEGVASLWAVEFESGRAHAIDVAPWTAISQISASPRGEALAFIGSAAAIPECVVLYMGGQTETVRGGDVAALHDIDLPAPRPLRWSAADGRTVHGLYFAPVGGGARPAAIIDVHSGPTRQRMAGFWAEAAFFATRGYAVLAVNYRGSSGYGRSYLRSLRGQWGEHDVEDVIGGATTLIDRGLADPKRLALIGSSAGGFTVLIVMARRPGMFRAGVCAYPVTDLEGASTQPFKFESHYHEFLVGRLPEAAGLYRARSPLHHAARLRDPLALFHGEEDPVVPIAHSEAIAHELAAHGVPHLLRRFPGEGHGWRKDATIVEYYSEIESFLRRHVLQAR